MNTLLYHRNPFRALTEFLLCLAVILILGHSASAQSDINLITFWGTTNNFSASSVRQSTNVITVTKGVNVAIAVTTQATAAGATSNMVFIVDSSIDAANWRLGTHNVQAQVAGTTATTTITNFNLGAINFLRLREAQQTNSVAVTNVIFKTSVKTGL